MKTKIDLFIHELFADTHKEIVFLPSIQYNRYGEVHSRYEWMKVMSIKFLIWEFGVSFTKIKKQKKSGIVDSYNVEETNYIEYPNFEQTTSVPEKQIDDLEQ